MAHENRAPRQLEDGRTGTGRHTRPGWRWTPIDDQVTADVLLRAVPRGSIENVREAARGVLARSTPPMESAQQETGLVVGYVQSGKTMSFTTLAAMARDNRFRLVIAITGTSVPLFGQSKERLKRDLGLTNPNAPRRWHLFENPRDEPATARAISMTFADWEDASVPDAQKQAVLIVVMKQHQRLQALNQLLATLGQDIDLTTVPTLIIDDEADQASLNNEVSAGSQSTTYARLLELKRNIPFHTFLQYTATPQAPLLINMIDALSPGFADVLEPGPDYVGGRDFFSGAEPLVRTIPPQDIPSANNILGVAPESLLGAMMEFFVGVAAGLHVDGGRGNRSMLVHPAPETDTHDEYFHWVDQVVQQWTRILDHGPTDPGYAALLARIQTAHSSIMLTHNTLPRLDELLPLMARAVRRTIIRIMNAARGPTPQIDWASNYSWILVGARAMDRGFTIEGLTVTYMPRNVGVGNADTLQQRARFFGYKRPYLGLCRVYLEQATRAVFRRYVEHEEDVRRQLIEHRNRGEHLDEWRRAFLLDRRLRPTRQNVLDLDYMHSIHSDDWVWPRVIYGSTAAENSSVAAAFEATLRFVPNRGNPARTLNQMHDIAAGISLAHVYEGLLWRLKFVGMEDTQKFLGLLLQLRRVLDSSVGANEACDIYRMSPAEVRTRTIRENGAISGTLFQGAAPVSPPHLRGSIYPGDSEIKDSDRVTVQLHRLTALRGGQTVASNVLVPAVWIPARLGRGWFVQDTP